ncbi:hypothetical protein [Serratia marcescens]|uniref:hypothetical protein n=1 Tax=Serratia marcescens TaxID=615 RepID=UPI0007C8F404|nr:hypothetical protein [Serratia marcescens]OAH25537.1 hypothetical protein AYJ10_12580 [Serratia marcescens]
MSISVDTSHLDKLEAQLERIAELCGRINGRQQADAEFAIATGNAFIEPATIHRSAVVCDCNQKSPLATEAGVKAASDAIARSVLEAMHEMADSVAEIDKRLVAAKQEELKKAQHLERRLLGIEAGIDHCMAGITSLRRRDSLV